MTNDPGSDFHGQTVHGDQTIIFEAEKVVLGPESREPPILPQQIPQPPADFKGRDDDIHDLLNRFDRGATITGLRGMGGVGKTALALVLADRLKDRFPNGRLYLEMQGTSKNPLMPEDAMAHIIRSYLGLDIRLPSDMNGLSGLYRSVLFRKKALILLDNAADRAQVEPLLPPAGSALLITSRNKFALAGLEELDLNVLPLEDAKKFLLSICERIGEHAEELADLCGCLPIALRNAASVLREKPNMGVAGYIKRLAESRVRLDKVEASFNQSYQLLAPEMQKLWSLLSVFPADFDLFGAAAVWEMECDATEDALGELVKWSLMDVLASATGEGGRYKLHDLARDFARSRLDSKVTAVAAQRHAEYYYKVLSVTNQIFKQGKENFLAGLKIFDQEKANIMAGQSWAETNMDGNFPAAVELCKSYPNAGAYVLDLRLSPREKIPWLNAGLQASRQSRDRVIEGNHLGNLGNAYSHLGEPKKAIEYYEQALKISREIGDRQGEGTGLGNLGNAYSDLGEPRKAIEYYEQALKIFREIGDRRGEGTGLGNLGNAYSDLGEPKRAIDYYDQELKISREIGDRQGEGIHMFNISLYLKEFGRQNDAIDLAQSALPIFEEIESLHTETVRKALARWKS